MIYGYDIELNLDFDRAAFNDAVEDVRTLMRRSEAPVAGPSGKPSTLPILEHGMIEFNGVNHGCRRPAPEFEKRIGRCTGECNPEYYRFVYDDDSHQAFIVNVNHNRYIDRIGMGSPVVSWFYCNTRYKPYDKAVMLAMLALKRHLGDSISLKTKASWGNFGGISDSEKPVPNSPLAIYEHVFPDRAPVKNILDFEGWLYI